MASRTNLDERLSDLTDRLLVGKNPEGTISADSDKDLSRAEETIQLLLRAYPDRQPDLELQNRIRAKLTAEWSKTGPGARKATGGWSTRQTQQRFVLRFALTVIIILVIALVAFPLRSLATPGAAGNASLWVPLIIVCVVLIILVIWQFRKNKRR